VTDNQYSLRYGHPKNGFTGTNVARSYALRVSLFQSRSDPKSPSVVIRPIHC